MKIIIIGAGAAGMMAAATIAENGSADVSIIEKNTVLGRKVVISGGGRCNLTTADNDVSSLGKAYPRGGKWLKFAMHEFGPSDVCKWFEEHGIPLKTEGLKIFPKSNKGTDVTELFDRLFRKMGVEVFYKTSVSKVSKVKDGFKVSFEDGRVESCNKLIITTGGSAYRHTGSTGDGYAFAEELGHTIKPLAATLSSFASPEKWVCDLAGVSIKNARFKLIGEKKHEISGAFLFTHKGVSGPGIFALSSLAAFEEISKAHPVKLFTDFAPDLSYDDLTSQLNNKIAQAPQKTFLRIVNDYMPKSLLAVVFMRTGIDGGKVSSETPKKDISRFVEAVKNFEMTLNERTPGSEIVTAGGVDLKEVDQKTMESKICPGLYFAGELLDIDGFTGGYNLQSAWATGRLAGLSAAGEES